MISIIIPAYNAQEYIGEALDSILAQSYTDIEVIVVNDGSTDDTLSILQRYAQRDPRIRIITTPNQGLSCARNTGIENAKGEFIYFIDSDDTMRADALSTLLTLINETGVNMAIGGWSQLPDAKGTDKFKIYAAPEALELMLYQSKLRCTAWNVLYRSQTIKDKRFPAGVYYEDLAFVPRVLVCEDKVAVTDRILYYYRVNPQGIINSYSPKRFDVLKVTQGLEDEIGALSPELLKATRDRRLSANFNMYGLIAANNDPSRAETADSCWQIIKRYRKESLFNPKVRLKNKVGIILSYLGRPMFTAIAKRFYS